MGIFVITAACIDVLDRGCVEACPVDCIYEGRRMLYIHPDECISCGACESVCPVQAIYPADYLPAELADYVEANASFFTDLGLGMPGGASGVGPTGYDPKPIAAAPTRASITLGGGGR